MKAPGKNAARRLLIHLGCVVGLALIIATDPADASFTQYDTQTYDLVNLGVPKFVDTVYIDLRKITQISKFRSAAGHDYSDGTQFSNEAVADVTGPERCVSMKHYFIAPDATVKIYAPTSGVVSRFFEEGIGGTQLQITSDLQPAFTFIVFHVELDTPVTEGMHIAAGQLLGHHTGSQTFSDIAVQVHTPKGYHHVSYFETLTDAAFAVFQARGVTSRDQMIYTKEQRAADKFTCAGTTFINLKTPAELDYFTLTGGAAKQTISAAFPDSGGIGDPPVTITATASSGLPVTLTSSAPKVCAVAGMTITWRRPGYCTLTLSQAGDENTFAAQGLQYSKVVNVPGQTVIRAPRLGGIFPPSASGPQSFLRLLSRSAGNATVTVTLFDGATGNTVATWKSPPLALNTERQFSISDLESAAPAVFTRPAVYGIKIEDLAPAGSFQHVVFSPGGVLTDASSCSSGLYGSPQTLIGVHTSQLAAGYPSTVIFANGLTLQGIFPAIYLRNANTGATIGFGAGAETPNHGPIPPFAQVNFAATALESSANYKADATTFHFIVEGSNYGFTWASLQHLVKNQAAGVIADMTSSCNLLGYFGQTTILSPLVAPSIYSASNPAAQSILRFYNSGSTAGPVTVTLHETVYGKAVGQWTSPSIPTGGEQQFLIGTIEDTIGLEKQANYTVSVDTAIDGNFQHILWRGVGSALSNASSCVGATTINPTTAIGVHSSALAAVGYTSTVIVNNLGTAAAPATIGVYDAVTGSRLGGFTTSPIPANAQVQFDSQTLETRAGVSVAGKFHYIVKVEGPFDGFVQHYVNSNGVITDMSLMCEM